MSDVMILLPRLQDCIVYVYDEQDQVCGKVHISKVYPTKDQEMLFFQGTDNLYMGESAFPRRIALVYSAEMGKVDDPSQKERYFMPYAQVLFVDDIYHIDTMQWLGQLVYAHCVKMLVWGATTQHCLPQWWNHPLFDQHLVRPLCQYLYLVDDE